MDDCKVQSPEIEHKLFGMIEIWVDVDGKKDLVLCKLLVFKCCRFLFSEPGCESLVGGELFEVLTFHCFLLLQRR